MAILQIYKIHLLTVSYRVMCAVWSLASHEYFNTIPRNYSFLPIGRLQCYSQPLPSGASLNWYYEPNYLLLGSQWPYLL